MTAKRKITFFIDSLRGGGAEKAVVNLLKELAKQDKYLLDLVLVTLEGPYVNQIPPNVNLINLDTGRSIAAILPLIKYLRQNRPWALISHMGHVNVVASIAQKLSLTDTLLLLVEHNTFSANKSNSIAAKSVRFLMEKLYPHADAVAGVSFGVSLDLERELNLKKGKVKVLNNPIVNEELLAKAQAPLEHPWLQKNSPPVFIAVGRLTAQKDFPTLIRAFAILRQQKAAKLIILGEGELRTELEQLVDNLGLIEDVSLPGFVNNPYVYMSRANAFVLSSLWEGLPTVLIEAMACGCPVIATNCPSGPEEILERGKYGDLIPMRDREALATAMLDNITQAKDRELLKQRATFYSVESTTARYLTLLNSLDKK